MRTLLGIFLALNGAAVWAITAFITILVGFALAINTGWSEHRPLWFWVCSIPIVIIFLGVGHLMIKFGLLLGSSSTRLPENDRELWIGLSIIRQAALVFILPLAFATFIRIVLLDPIAIPLGVLTTSLGIASAKIANYSEKRFQTKS